MRDDKFIFEDHEYTTVSDRDKGCSGCSISDDGGGLVRCERAMAAARVDCSAEHVIFLRLRDE